MPGRVCGPKARRRSRIGAKAQHHEGRQSPTRPILCLACGPHSAPQPAHRRTCASIAVIARTRDNRNRNLSRNIAPPRPAIKLRQIVGAHQPDEAMFGVKPPQSGQRIGSVARLQPQLDRAGADRRMARHRPRRRHARGERRHACHGFERIAGGHQPPHLIQPQRPHRMQRQPPMPLVRRVERAAEETDAFQGLMRQSSRSWRMRTISTVRSAT